MKHLYLAAVGDVNDPRTWSGIPFHALQEGRRQGFIDEGLPLGVAGIGVRARRYIWNMKSLLMGKGRGGFQYSVEFLEHLWKPFRQTVAEQRILNCFQLYPPSLLSDNSDLSFFLDQTLLQLFDTYGIRSEIGHWIAEDALRREREGYQHASHLIMHSDWAKQSLIDDYGIDEKKVSVVVPGANLDPEAYRLWSEEKDAYPIECSGTVRLVFVGKHPYRKGLDRLLRAFQILVSKRLDCKLFVIGCDRTSVPADLRNIPEVDWLGFFDKRNASADYLKAVGRCDIGCLLSRSEAGGIGLREYHALGLAVVAPSVGGSSDHIVPGASTLISPNESDREVAEKLIALVHDRNRLEQMKRISWENRHRVCWQSSIESMKQLMGQDS